MNKKILTTAISTVGILLAAFGGIAVDVQPPGEGIGKLIGFISSFSALLILLIIASLADNLRTTAIKYIWIVIGFVCLLLFMKISLDYIDRLDDYTVTYSLKNDKYKRYLVGDTLDKDGIRTQAYLLKNSIPVNKYNLINNGGSPDNIKGIWTEGSIVIRNRKLMHDYIFVMMFLTIGIFSITEGAFFRNKTRGTRNKANNKTKTTKNKAKAQQ